jgi:hypothetical protein
MKVWTQKGNWKPTARLRWRSGPDGARELEQLWERTVFTKYGCFRSNESTEDKWVSVDRLGYGPEYPE